MTAWWAQCRREWLEHRLSLGWIPLVFAVLMLVFATLVILYAHEFVNDSSVAIEEHAMEERTIDEQVIISERVSAANTVVMTERTAPPAFTQQVLLMSNQSVASFFAILFLFTGFVVLINSVFDERQDRSVLFWKSMPVSDRMAVLSKLFTVMVTSAGVILLCALVVQIYSSLLAIYWPPAVATHTTLTVADARLPVLAAHWLVGFLTQAFWSLPIWGWALMVSAAARSVPYLWGIGLPLAAVALWKLIVGDSFLWEQLWSHLELRALPNYLTHTSFRELFFDQWGIWSSGSMWVGILLGVLFVWAAIVLRQRNNQL